MIVVQRGGWTAFKRGVSGAAECQRWFVGELEAQHLGMKQEQPLGSDPIPRHPLGLGEAVTKWCGSAARLLSSPARLQSRASLSQATGSP